MHKNLRAILFTNKQQKLKKNCLNKGQDTNAISHFSSGNGRKNDRKTQETGVPPSEEDAGYYYQFLLVLPFPPDCTYTQMRLQKNSRVCFCSTK